MIKPFFTRKNLIAISISFFYSLVIVFTGICIDGAHAIISKKNLFNKIDKLNLDKKQSLMNIVLRIAGEIEWLTVSAISE